jgi:hypothetical protein
MKPRSKRESYWRMMGREYRKLYQQGVGAARTARQFTRRQSNKAMRAMGKRESRED